MVILLNKIIFIFGLLLIAGCNTSPETSQKEVELTNQLVDLFAQCETNLNELRMNQFVEQANWKCVEWKNKTTINPDYIENCCIRQPFAVSKEKSESVNLTAGDKEFAINISIRDDKVFWYGPGICLDSEPNEEYWNYSTISIDGYSVDMDKCKATKQFIETNESICVTKELKGYG